MRHYAYYWYAYPALCAIPRIVEFPNKRKIKKPGPEYIVTKVGIP